jgi:hypothetical protein
LRRFFRSLVKDLSRYLARHRLTHFFELAAQQEAGAGRKTGGEALTGYRRPRKPPLT